MKPLSFLLLIFSLDALWAQPVFTPFDHIKVTERGKVLEKPWDGGFNNPQFSTADLNHDGLEDLVIFDASDNRIYTYINGGDSGVVDYYWAPEYTRNFPPLHDMVLMRDYNCDGIADIFAYSSAGIQVWKGRYDSLNHLAFDFVIFRLTYPSGSFDINIYIDPVNLPAITDVDGDGDLDIVAFEQFGGTVAWYQNRSQELGYGCDSLLFIKKTNCWGEFCECSSWRNTITLNYNDPNCFYIPFYSPKGSEWLAGHYGQDTLTRHAGSTVTLFDQDRDGDMEALIGDVSFDNLVYLYNGHLYGKDQMTAQDSTFPAYNVSVDLPVFPAAYLLDVNNDNKKDLLVSSYNINYCMLDPLLDTAANVENILWYRNVSPDSTYQFQYETDEFLTGEMIDLGENAYPAFFDYNADGLTDILVGTCYRYDREDTLLRGLSLYENIGGPGSPRFRLVTRDYEGFSALNARGLVPAFGDLDGDGDQDMLCGNIGGTFIYFENQAGAGNPPQFVYQTSFFDSLQVGEYSNPQIVDVDRDGLPDIISGERQGNVYWFRNIGTPTAPHFKLESAFFGQVDVRDGAFFGFSSPRLVPYGPSQEYILLVGSEKGKLFMYDQVENNLYGAFHLVSKDLLDSLRAYRISIDVADLNADGKFELIAGQLRGGLQIYSTGDTTITGQAVQPPAPGWQLYPNPARNTVTLVFDAPARAGKVRIFDTAGRLVLSASIEPGKTALHLDTGHLPPGQYFVSVRTGETFAIRPLVFLP